MLSRRQFAGAATLALTALAPLRASAGTKISVAYAGSMGVVMDQGLNPAFTKLTGTDVQGRGQGAMALAHLLSAKTISADVFVPVSAGPVKIVQQAGLIGTATPVASTSIVLAYSPKSKFASAFAVPDADWRKILLSPGLRFGRTDPATDPQGQYVLYTLQLAQAYFHLPGFAARVAGAMQNPAQIFAEPSLLARLQAGQIDATFGYKSAVVSQHLPYIELPAAINFSTPAQASAYAKAALTITHDGKSKTIHPTPLVFYAAALKNAADPAAAKAYVDFLLGAEGQKLFAQYGYGPGLGGPI